MKILFIGLGSIARKHIRVLNDLLPDAEIFAMRSSTTGEDIQGIQNLFSWEEVPKDLYFILIANPTGMHASAIESALALGCPIFIEKPVLMKRDEATAILPKIRESKTPTYVGCNLRFLECIGFVRSYILQHNPRINEVSIYCGSYLPDWRPHMDFRESYSADPLRGGGVQLDLIHELDYMYWIFGKPELTHRVTRNQSSLQISASDFAHYTCQYPGFSTMVTLNYYRRDPRRTFELVFEDQTWQVDLLKNRVTKGDEVIFESNQTIVDTYHLQMEYFLSCISLKKPIMNDFEDGLEVLDICLS